VLIALSLETKQQKCISIDQLHQFSGYSLSWIQGEKVNLYQKQLTTPALAELKNPEIKKLLWQQLHSVSSFKQN
jgi:DNA polymerase III psi subunit